MEKFLKRELYLYLNRFLLDYSRRDPSPPVCPPRDRTSFRMTAGIRGSNKLLYTNDDVSHMSAGMKLPDGRAKHPKLVKMIIN